MNFHGSIEIQHKPILPTISDLSKRLEDTEKLEFIQILGLHFCTDSSIAMLEVVKQALKAADYQIVLSESSERSIEFLLNYLDQAIKARNLLLELSGDQELNKLLQEDNILQEKISTFVMAIPVYLGGSEIVRLSETYIKATSKRVDSSKREGLSQSSQSRIDTVGSEPDDNQLGGYKEQDLEYFVEDLMDYLQQMKIELEKKGKIQGVIDESKILGNSREKIQPVGYYGEIVNALKEGRGKYYYPNGDVYDGEWKNDKKCGYGVYINHEPKGEKYEGEWKEDKYHGRGVYYYANKGKYDGEWAEGKRNGYGICWFEDGSRYEGEWKNGQMHGKGVYFYSNGCKFMGEWENGKIHGTGIFEMKNGYQIEEEWKRGFKKKEYFKTSS